MRTGKESWGLGRGEREMGKYDRLRGGPKQRDTELFGVHGENSKDTG